MNVQELSSFVEQPETHRKILGAYRGAYSLGVGRASRPEGRSVLMLQVAKAPAVPFPSSVELGGEEVPVVVRSTDFKAPVALTR